MGKLFRNGGKLFKNLTLENQNLLESTQEKESRLKEDIHGLQLKNQAMLECMQKLATITDTEQVEQLRSEVANHGLKIAAQDGTIAAQAVEIAAQAVEIAAANLAHECPVCMNSRKSNSVAMIPCGHVVCPTCITKLSTCPNCRKDIQSSLPLFYS